MKDAVEKLLVQESLSEEETFELFEKFLGDGSDELSDDQIRAYLLHTSSRLPTTNELVGASRSLRKHLVPLDTSALSPSTLLDTCGTGGSGLNTFNTSTVVGLTCAAGGLFVAKHGNRAVSSACGSADVLEALGMKLNLSPQALADCLRSTGFTFLFAPAFHPATKRVQTIRRTLGKRTIFNFLGPLVNPAGVRCQLLGVSNRDMVVRMAGALARLGTDAALVVSGEDGLDEMSLCSRTHVCELRDGVLREYQIEPEQYGFRRAGLDDIRGAAPVESAIQVSRVLAGETSPRAQLVELNAGAAFSISGLDSSIEAGIVRARELLQSGAARKKLEEVVSFTARSV
ncbi:MAG: anthranilate phosphoribosyltransferase [Bdellovibrionota bacterium]